MEQRRVRLSEVELVLEHTDSVEVGQVSNEDKPIFLRVSGLLLIRMSRDQTLNLKQDLEKVLWGTE